MKKFPKPWFRPSRGLWYVTLNGVQHNLGPDKDAAFAQYRQLLGQPGQVAVSRHTVSFISPRVSSVSTAATDFPKSSAMESQPRFPRFP